MSVGDFNVIETFENNESFLFWVIFMIGNLASLLIILNMVIAVMSSTFERVQEDVDCYINKMKIENLIEYTFRLDEAKLDSLKKAKYLLLINVNPDTTEPESTESVSQMRGDMNSLE